LVRTTWARKGKTPYIKHAFTRDKLSAISAVTTNPHFYMKTFRCKGISGVMTVKFLEHLKRLIKNKVYIVWDNVSTHRSAVVKEYIKKSAGRFRLFPIPGYAPELNADEGPWAQLKWHELKGYCARNLEELEKRVRKGGRKIQKSKRLIRSFLHRTPLNFDHLSINLCRNH
jgi:transposase